MLKLDKFSFCEVKRFMTRIVNRPIEMLEQDEWGNPRRFRDRDTFHTVVDVIDKWKEAGKWWEEEAQRDMYKVVTNHGVYELQEQGGKWVMYRVLD